MGARDEAMRAAACDYCSGTGLKWQLPEGHNPFEMSIFSIARTVRRVPCHCAAADALAARAHWKEPERG